MLSLWFQIVVVGQFIFLVIFLKKEEKEIKYSMTYEWEREIKGLSLLINVKYGGASNDDGRVGHVKRESMLAF